MNITTKFDLGQKCFFLNEITQKVMQEPVYRIDTEHDESGKATIKYWFYPDKQFHVVNEIRVFLERQELIDSL